MKRFLKEKKNKMYEVVYYINNDFDEENQSWLFTEYEDAVAFTADIIAREKAGDTMLRDMLEEMEKCKEDDLVENYYYKEDEVGVYMYGYRECCEVQIYIKAATVYTYKERVHEV